MENLIVINYLWILAWAVIVLAAFHLRAKRRERRLEILHKERMAAIEKGVPLPELDGEQAHQRVNPKWSLGVGAILTMLGFGILAALIVSPDENLHRMWSLGLIWVFAGFGFVAYYYLTNERGR
jgi:hypothetical protein